MPKLVNVSPKKETYLKSFGRSILIDATFFSHMTSNGIIWQNILEFVLFSLEIFLSASNCIFTYIFTPARETKEATTRIHIFLNTFFSLEATLLQRLSTESLN